MRHHCRRSLLGTLVAVIGCAGASGPSDPSGPSDLPAADRPTEDRRAEDGSTEDLAPVECPADPPARCRWEGGVCTCEGKFPRLDRMEFVSLHPARRAPDGAVDRLCEPPADDLGPADSLLLHVNLLSTEFAAPDLDRSLRPGDVFHKEDGPPTVLEAGSTVSASFLRVDLDCLESHPDPDLAGNAGCQGVAGPRDAAPQGLDYRAFHEGAPRPSPTDEGAMTVAVLVDLSGSTAGFVDPEGFQEASSGTPWPWQAAGFEATATDRDFQRMAAVRTFLADLNPGDQAALFGFGETVGGGAAILCDAAQGETEAERRRACFGPHAKPCTSSAAYRALGLGSMRGRTPLWGAVADVYDFLKTDGGGRVRHLVVVGDGPDTCHPGSPDFRPVLRRWQDGQYVEFRQEAACSETSFEAFLARVAADRVDAGGKAVPSHRAPVHVSFLQIQAPGYPERDARQQQVACLTGGHHLFVNAHDLTDGQVGQSPGRAALLAALDRLRFALAGSWALSVDLPDLAQDRLPRGAEMAVAGRIALSDSPLGHAVEAALRIGYVDPATPDGNLPRLDLRGAFRVPCVAGDACAWRTDGTGCAPATCRAVDALCLPAWSPDGTPCGAAGSCCQGGCVEGAPPGSLDALCNAAPGP